MWPGLERLRRYLLAELRRANQELELQVRQRTRILNDQKYKLEAALREKSALIEKCRPSLRHCARRISRRQNVSAPCARLRSGPGHPCRDLQQTPGHPQPGRCVAGADCLQGQVRA